MSHPCQYNVYLSRKGESKKIMLASFSQQVDSVNFAYEKSKGQFSGEHLTLVALGVDRKVFMKFRQGERV